LNTVERKVQRPAMKPDAVFSFGCLAGSGWRLTNAAPATLLVELHKSTTSAAVVASCPAATPMLRDPL
jgi:hypothetical protein